MTITSRARRAASAPLGVLDTLGDQASFFARTIGWIPKSVTRYQREVLRLLTEVAFGSGALALIGGTVVIVATLTFFTGSVVGLQSYSALNQIGTSAFSGFVTAYFNTREVAPLVSALALSATVGAGFTAQLGAQRVSEEIDALEVMAVPSLPFLVTTRVVAGFIAVIPLYVIGLVASYLAARLLVTNFYTQSPGTYDHYFNLFLPPQDVMYSFGKVLVFALVIILVHCYYGYNASGGPAGVGVAVGNAVRNSIVIFNSPGQPADPGHLGHDDLDQDRRMSAPTQDTERDDWGPQTQGQAAAAQPDCAAGSMGLALLLVMLLIVGAVPGELFNKVFKPVETVYLQHRDRRQPALQAGRRQGPRHHRRRDHARSTATARARSSRWRCAPDFLPTIPSNTTAMLIPKTLFGERYVSLSIPPNAEPAPAPGGRHHQPGPVANATETEQVLNNLLPVLTAVQPQKLSDTLGAISQSLSGRGEQLGNTLVLLNQYVEGLNPSLPDLQANLRALAPTADIYNQASPDLLARARQPRHHEPDPGRAAGGVRVDVPLGDLGVRT